MDQNRRITNRGRTKFLFMFLLVLADTNFEVLSKINNHQARAKPSQGNRYGAVHPRHNKNDKNRITNTNDGSNDNSNKDNNSSSNDNNSNSTDFEKMNVTAQLGYSVFLDCTTLHSMDRQVSWVRRRDWHILTSGTAPYIQDQRFFVHHTEGTTKWTLEIKYVKPSDEGLYECQVATGRDSILSKLFYVEVIVPKAMIPGKQEHHVETGSTIKVDCIIKQSPTPPQFIFWYHKDRMINYNIERTSVSIDVRGPNVYSRLTVVNARSSDTGNYTCDAANTEAASIFLYVTEANNIAVIQPRDSSDDANSADPNAILIVMNSVILAFSTSAFGQLAQVMDRALKNF